MITCSPVCAFTQKSRVVCAAAPSSNDELPSGKGVRVPTFQLHVGVSQKSTGQPHTRCGLPTQLVQLPPTATTPPANIRFHARPKATPRFLPTQAWHLINMLTDDIILGHSIVYLIITIFKFWVNLLTRLGAIATCEGDTCMTDMKTIHSFPHQHFQTNIPPSPYYNKECGAGFCLFY